MSSGKIKSPVFLFCLIVAAAALFRLTNLDLIEFKADEAINLFLASRPLFGQSLPPGGTVSSIGLLNPPLFNYLLFPLTLISLDPRMISFFIGLLNSLAIGFFFLLVQRYYRTNTALIASLFWAFSPWAILFSRKIWTQNLILPFLILLLCAFHWLVVDKKPSAWAIYAFTSLCLLQLHQSSLFFLLSVGLFLIIKRVKVNFGYLALGLGLGLLPAIPYFIYLFKNFSSDSTAFLVAKERFSPQYFPAIFFRPFQIMSQGNFHFVLGDDMLTFAQNFPLAYHLRRFFYLEYLLLPLGVFIFWKKFPSLRPIVYASLALPLIYFLLHFEPFIHYFLILVPLLFLFLAEAFAFFFQSKNRLAKYGFYSLFGLLIVTSLVFNLSFFQLLNQRKALQGDYGTIFAVSQQTVEEKLAPYQDDKAYPEMVLASYLPRNLFYGHLPLGKMLYSPEQVQPRLADLKKRLEAVPDDPRVQLELTAFYTAPPITLETIQLLEEKSQTLPGYQSIYQEVNNVFLQQNP